MSQSHSYVTEGVVLSRRPYSEYDVVATLYTERFGKLAARFIGVRRPRGKLKALTEPMVHGEYRLYAKPGREWETATGGRIVNSFPGLRLDFDRTCHGLRLCELLSRVTADHAPNPLELRLMLDSLASLERTGSPWIATAFGLRLLDLAGFGLRHAKPEDVDAALWRTLHDEPLGSLERRPDAEPARRRVENRLEGAFEALIERRLSTSVFNDSIRRIRFDGFQEAAA